MVIIKPVADESDEENDDDNDNDNDNDNDIKPVADESDQENDNDSGGGDAGGKGDEGGGEDLVDDGGALLNDVQLNLVVDLGQVLCELRLYESVVHQY